MNASILVAGSVGISMNRSTPKAEGARLLGEVGMTRPWDDAGYSTASGQAILGNGSLRPMVQSCMAGWACDPAQLRVLVNRCLPPVRPVQQ